jgi:hypothetical protein
MGYVSQAHVDLMLADKKELLELLDFLRLLCDKPSHSRTSSAMAPNPGELSSSQKGAHRTPAGVEYTPRGRSQQSKSSDAVKVLVKAWLEVRSSILSLNDAYSGISQENLVQISWFPARLS